MNKTQGYRKMLTNTQACRKHVAISRSIQISYLLFIYGDFQSIKRRIRHDLAIQCIGCKHGRKACAISRLRQTDQHTSSNTPNCSLNSTCNRGEKGRKDNSGLSMISYWCFSMDMFRTDSLALVIFN